MFRFVPNAFSAHHGLTKPNVYECRWEGHMAFATRTTGKKRAPALLGASCVALIALLVAVPAAFGQSASGQYDPSLDPGGIVQGSNGSGNGGQNNDGASDPGESTGGESTGGGTDLPFTGYPLTPLVTIVGMLLVGGLALRLIAPLEDRNRP
jgi:hypothetical protein